MGIEGGRSLGHVTRGKPSADAIQLEYTLDFRFAVRDANITLRTLAEFSEALGLRVVIEPDDARGASSEAFC